VQPDLDRLLALVRRELGAHEVHVLEADANGGEPSLDGERSLRCRLPDGRGLVAVFEEPPPDRESKQRRLEMLASTFDVLVDEPATKPRSRPPIARSLHDELEGLCGRASSVNALVVDANSPVVWGAARSHGLGAEWPVAGEAREADDEHTGENEIASQNGESSVAAASRAALAAVRAMGALAALRKGRHFRHVERETAAPFLAHSFAGIYLLVLVFDTAFDELRAERAITESLSRVEQLVLALPPLDPSPGAGAGAIAIQRPRRR
jgi:hypothetical protein